MEDILVAEVSMQIGGKTCLVDIRLRRRRFCRFAGIASRVGDDGRLDELVSGSDALSKFEVGELEGLELGRVGLKYSAIERFLVLIVALDSCVSTIGDMKGSEMVSTRCLFAGGLKIPFKARLLYVLTGGPDLMLLSVK
jgi:hypothetical protein